MAPVRLVLDSLRVVILQHLIQGGLALGDWWIMRGAGAGSRVDAEHAFHGLAGGDQHGSVGVAEILAGRDSRVQVRLLSMEHRHI